MNADQQPEWARLLANNPAVLRQGYQRVALQLSMPPEPTDGMSIAMLLGAMAMLGCQSYPRAWVGESFHDPAIPPDQTVAETWQLCVTLADQLRARCIRNPVIAAEVANLLLHSNAIEVVFEHIANNEAATVLLLQRFYADLSNDDTPLDLYPREICRVLLSMTTNSRTYATTTNTSAETQQNQLLLLWALLKHRIGQPIRSISQQRRIDAAAPSSSPLGKAFNLIVQIQLPHSPLLTPDAFPMRRRPASVVTDEKRLGLDFPIDPASGRAESTYVVITIVAPDCDILGSGHQRIEVPINRSSVQALFLLQSRKIGLANIDVQVFRVDDVTLCALPVDVDIGTGLIESPMQTASVVVHIGTVNIIAGDSVMGDKVGDTITVGNITDSSGIAIGRGAKSITVKLFAYDSFDDDNQLELYVPMHLLSLENIGEGSHLDPGIADQLKQLIEQLNIGLQRYADLEPAIVAEIVILIKRAVVEATRPDPDIAEVAYHLERLRIAATKSWQHIPSMQPIIIQLIDHLRTIIGL